MRKLTCVITDDEPMACEGLRSYVEKVDFLVLRGVCEDALQLNTLLKTERPDLLLLDIEMPYLSGLELLATLADPPKVIITSAYEQYALKGYELEVTDYLLKPISFERFLKAVNRVHALAEAESRPLLPEEDFVFVKCDKQMVKIFLSEILLVEGLENYVVVYTAQRKWVVHSTLKRIMESLPDDRFLQTHRSYVVNRQAVSRVEGNRLVVGEHKVPIARNLREEVLRRILTRTL